MFNHLKHGQELLPQLRQIICLVARFRSLFFNLSMLEKNENEKNVIKKPY